jgi:hypothetical protein
LSFSSGHCCSLNKFVTAAAAAAAAAVQKTGRQPDFNSKAKDEANRRMGLWIDSNNTPEWVISYLLPGGRQRSSNRSGGGGYNSSSYGNQGMSSADAYMPEQASSEVEASWMDLCNNYRGWFDNRANVSAVTLRVSTALHVISMDRCDMLSSATTGCGRECQAPTAGCTERLASLRRFAHSSSQHVFNHFICP